MSSIRLVAQTREIPPVEDLLAHTSPVRPLAWLRRGDGFVAAGEGMAASIRVPAGRGAVRSAIIADAWRELVANAEIDDLIGMPGTGLVALGALTFDEDSAADSLLIIPQTIIGRRDGRSWITRIRDSDAEFAPVADASAYAPHWAGRVGPGAQTPQGYQESVQLALDEIAADAYSKVVLARDLTGTVPGDADLRRLVRALSSGYPDTWTFAVDGLIGASPETLVTVHERTVTARVLAGTTARGADPDADNAASAALASSGKDLDEHEYAVQSVLASLRPHTRTLAASEQPFTLKLPNLFHLATDVEGELDDGASALDLVGAMHPTAAVAGTPTATAVAAIRRIEPFDRGRYAGPVGWIDAAGNGEWAIALRCAQFAETPDSASGARRVTAYAGAGIVAGSDPESELLETRVKFRPLVDALA
ncbi:Isochorismate synthase @ Menaquinone-specific isochorismate synthase [Microbacterium esteraromaticum]|uniref:isochorismate synthase n=1 Tax=Microbacterium esteraromaticum TaxID=57043 RepID=A0A1R4J1M2_9MICO|nr:isochorismate synthase [Microbacterium esteraromaticum]SJN25919.1 Isochorismate synthase @ Menaquinone-specific isochorismate synthase [Microbacterium esteraromaticum]